MSHPAFVIAFAIFIWWFSTGVVFVMARKGERHGARVAIGATALALIALVGLYLSARSETVLGTYVAFGSALLVWAWHELTFLMGLISGPRKAFATQGLTGTDRFREAFATVRDHELAIAATALLIVILTLGAPNTVGMWTFLVLWALRVTAKLSIYFGARNSLNEMMPERLSYLKSYFRTDRTHAFLPLVILVGLAVFAWLCGEAQSATQIADRVGIILLVSLLGLAILEHLFLMLPVADSVLWLWAAPTKKTIDDTTVRSSSGAQRTGTKTVKGESVSWT